MKTKTKQQVIDEIITLRPYLNNKKQGLRNQTVEELKEFLKELKGEDETIEELDKYQLIDMVMEMRNVLDSIEELINERRAN